MQSGRHFQVRVEGIGFAAAHFATYGGACEPLHGHNYSVAAQVEGALSEESWVFDFVELKSILRGFCRELDHRFLLQRESRLLKIDASDDAWQVETPGGLRYSLPATDVVALPVDNTTAERLAEWLSERLAVALAERGATNVTSVSIDVSEGPGQLASHRQERLPLD
jgi:6-pyruvoyltetrahydropterin/6-carboxytetrahydropterin synthase